MFTKHYETVSARFAKLALAVIIIIGSATPVSARAMPFATASPGALDISFDGDGLLTTALGDYSDGGNEIAIQPDGKIIIAGTTTVVLDGKGNANFALIRYNSDGTLDTSFDTDGMVFTDFGESDSAGTIALQPDGKIIAAGTTNPSNSDAKFAIARYNADGSLDTSFDTDGKVITNLGSGYDSVGDIVIQPDGKIIVIGSKNIGINNDDIVVIRYNSDGSLDTTFDIDGIVITAVSSGGDFGGSVAIQLDGKIIVGGTTFNTDTKTDFMLVRYNSDGSLDTSFDTDGIVTTDFGVGYGYDRGGDLALQPDGKIILAGYSDDGGFGYFLLAHYNNDGSLDTSFDTDGLVATSNNGLQAIQAMTLQQNGKIVLVGYSSLAGSYGYDFVVARYKSDGSLDSTFHTDGVVTTDFGIDQDDLANSVAIQQDGKIVVAGYRYIEGSNYDVALARYIGDDTNTVAPTVDTFTATTPSYTLHVPITAFTASDDVAVTGYKITTTTTPPQAGARGWSSTAPTTYTVTSGGIYTLYPWAKDPAGNVSTMFAMPVSVVVESEARLTTFENIPLTIPTELSRTYLLGVWGSDANDMYTVGWGFNSTTLKGVPLMYHNDGSGWMETSPPIFAGWDEVYFDDVWGFGASDVYAVGTGVTTPAGTTPPLAYHNGGSGWTVTQLPVPAGYHHSNLHSIWGSAPTDIYAVGDSYASGGYEQPMPLLYHNDGTGWEVDIPVMPAGLDKGNLSDVWGSSNSDVYAVGQGHDPNGYYSLLFHQDGNGWVEETPALPDNWSDGDLNGVWGFTDSDVYIVGGANDPSEILSPLIYHYDGSNWTYEIPSLPWEGSKASLYSVWGSSPSDMYAAGYVYDADNHKFPLLYHNDGAGWLETTPALPDGWTEGDLDRVWGIDADHVYVVGDGKDSSGRGIPLLYQSIGPVDTQAPTVDTFTATTPSNRLDIPITAFTASDNITVTGYMITTNSTTPTSGASGWMDTVPTTYTVANEGPYTLYPWVKDAAGNVSSVFATPVTVLVDVAPTVAMTSTASDPTNLSPIPVTVQFSEIVTDFLATDITATNGTVDNFAAVDGDTYTFDLTPAGQGEVMVEIAQNVAVDATGNGNLAATPFSRTYDEVSPAVTSIVRVGSEHTSAGSVVFIVTFSEPVIGIETTAPFNDFTLTTTGVSGAAITEISGANTTWTVTVNTGFGDGTIRLDVPDTVAISDLVGNPLADLPYTSGEAYTIVSMWYLRGIGSYIYGTSDDIPVPADYNGDGKDEIAVFRPSNSTWYIYGIGPSVYGTVGDIPVVADYNGDGKDEIAVFRPSNSTWYIRGIGSFVYGTSDDIPVPADYNGDGKDEIAVFRPSNSTWYIRGIGSFVYGTVGDIPVPADYNDDGKDEIAVFRPSNSTWYIYGIGPSVYGTVGDIPVVADYNGDGKDEIAVFRPSNSTWYIYGIGPSVYGTVGDIPVVADYNGDGKAEIAVFRP